MKNSKLYYCFDNNLLPKSSDVVDVLEWLNIRDRDFRGAVSKPQYIRLTPHPKVVLQTLTHLE